MKQFQSMNRIHSPANKNYGSTGFRRIKVKKGLWYFRPVTKTVECSAIGSGVEGSVGVKATKNIKNRISRMIELNTLLT